MSYESEEKATFNRALINTEETSKKILNAYRLSLKEVKSKIAIYRQRQIESPLSPGSAAQLKRLENLYNEVDLTVKELTAEQYRVTKTAYVANWLDTYYATGFNIEGEVSQAVTGLDVGLPYRKLNKKFVENVFTRSIAGQTFRDRIGRNRIEMQSRLKDQVASAIVEGLSAKELQVRLRDLDTVFATNLNKALLTSQQELMTAYSFGQEDAISTAVSSGVEGDEIWRSVLDGKTRTKGSSKPPNHKTMDGVKKNEETGLFTFPTSGQTIKAPRIIGTGTAGLNQIMRCRCRKLFLPFGIKSTKRLAKLPDGKWKEVNGDLNYTEWANNLKDPRSLQGEIAYRRKRDESN